MLHLASDLRRSSAVMLGGLLLLIAAAVLLAALAFEHIGGYAACPLCLQQRYAYYAALPALSACLVLLRSRRTALAAAIFLLVGAAFAINAGLGIYQAGAEWKFWDLAACDTPATLPVFDLNKLDFDKAAVCGVASWRFMGLSFAGWNAVVSVLLALGSLTAALKASRRLP